MRKIEHARRRLHVMRNARAVSRLAMIAGMAAMGGMLPPSASAQSTTAHIFARVGGRQVWVGKPQVMVTGPQAEAWDLAFIAEYPDAEAFIAMVRDPEYRELVKHRTAGVADSRLQCLTPVTPGEGFGE